MESSLDLKNIISCLRNDDEVDIEINKFKTQLEYYKNLNTVSDRIFKKLKIQPDNLSPQSQETLNNLTALQYETDLNSLDVDDISKAFLDTAEKRYRFKYEIEKLKDYEATLINNIEDTKNEIQRYEEEIKLAEKQINSIEGPSEVDKNSMKILLKSYEEKIKNFVEKYNWSKDPEFNVIHIKEEIKKLRSLQNECEQLEVDKSVYQGLEPDLSAAKIQLKDLKLKYETLCKTLEEHGGLK